MSDDSFASLGSSCPLPSICSEPPPQIMRGILHDLKIARPLSTFLGIRDALYISTARRKPLHGLLIAGCGLHDKFNTISGMRRFQFLTGTRLLTLSLGDAPVSDISALADLASLTMLSLWKTRVLDVTPLASLTRLTCLSLAETQVYDVTPLKHLRKLLELNLEDSRVFDVPRLPTSQYCSSCSLRRATSTTCHRWHRTRR